MTDPKGGFYSSQDADSEGEEGKFFVWQPEEIDAVVGEEAGRAIRAHYDVREGGNWEGKSILHVANDAAVVAASLEMSEERLRALVEEARPTLLVVRERRVRPSLDDKVVVAWNGMMLKAFAEAGAALERKDWLDVARRNADFLLRELVSDGRLLRSWRDGRASSIKGYLEDYAFLADGLLALYEATFERRWLDESVRLADAMIDLFWDVDEEVFYDTGRDHEVLLVRPRDVFDNASPSGSSMAASLLLRLGLLTGRPEYGHHPPRLLRSVRDMMAQAPSGFANWLSALDFYLSDPREIAVIGPRQNADTRALLREVYGRYLPNRVVAGAEGAVADPPTPLLVDRGTIDGRPAAYVCVNYVCQQPVTEPSALAEQLS